MNEFVKDKDYGDSIQHYYIGCICIKEKQGYEDSYRLRRPRYRKEIEDFLDGLMSPERPHVIY